MTVPKPIRNILSLDFFIILILYFCNVFIQTFLVGKQIYPLIDEGFYLYAAKLISQGHMPYIDFAFPSSHVPFLIYINAGVLQLVHFDLNIYHYFYVFWVFLTVFPLYYTTLFITRNRFVAIFSVCVFATFPEFVQWDAHFFAIRQAATPFFAFFIYFFFVKEKRALAFTFLNIFALCLVTNLFISISFYILSLFFKEKNKQKISLNIETILCGGSVIFLLFYYLVIILYPNILNILLASQHKFVSYPIRLEATIVWLSLNWFIVVLGVIGAILVIPEIPHLGYLAFICLFVSFFISGSWYVHYLTAIAVPFSITAGYFLKRLFLYKKLFFVFCIGSFFVLSVSVFPYLYNLLLVKQTPVLLHEIAVLKQTRGPLMTWRPFYALYAQKDIPFFYNAGDMLILALSHKNLSQVQYHHIINASNTIVLDDLAKVLIPPKEILYIQKHFQKIYEDSTIEIYTRR